MDVIEGRFPPGMQSRCAWCRSIVDVEEGEFVDVGRSALGPSRVFRCSDCDDASAA
jgi:uncharacterized protein YlaI